MIFSFRNEWPTTTRRPIDPYILYGPHGYRTFSHARCQEVPTVDVNPSEVNSDSSECTHKVVIIIIRLHDHAISLWMKVTKKVSFYNITILARKFKFLIGFSSNTEFDKKWDFFGDFDPLCIFFFFARFPEIGTSMNTSLVLMVNHFHHIRHICARNHWWKYHQFKTENSTFHRFEKSHKKSYLKSLIDHCKQSELRLHFDWPKIVQFGEFWKT